MPHSPPRRTPQLRLALKLADALPGVQRVHDPLVGVADDLVNAAARLRQTVQRHRHCRTRQWRRPAAHTRSQIHAQLRDLRYALAPLDHAAPVSTLTASASEILADLKALDEEFDDLVIADDLSALSVVTDPITLEEIPLGRFRIELSIHKLLQGRFDGSVIEAIALDPNPSTRDESVTHPHVQAGSVCLGDGASALRGALSEGRLYDAITVVSAILHTYNVSSPYIALDVWHGHRCGDCDDVVNETYTCQRCDRELCPDCERICDDCQESYCRRCLETDGDDLVCASCLEQREQDRQQQEQETEDEQTHPTPVPT